MRKGLDSEQVLYTSAGNMETLQRPAGGTDSPCDEVGRPSHQERKLSIIFQLLSSESDVPDFEDMEELRNTAQRMGLGSTLERRDIFNLNAVFAVNKFLSKIKRKDGKCLSVRRCPDQTFFTL